ncbi:MULTISPECIES: replication initiation protein [Enterococcaceae]|jgi:plasmid replication initiation protein|uniref:replication initiation protein n=1 Tax=Enterococcaceae TaxID=81852 RepID=UPI0010E725E1|nr:MULTISPECIES: replication initiation protein [Enterococcus]VLA63440.1 replication protein [Streptococcus pneumoniae]ARX76272.1 replication initiation protein, repB family [Enterococcus sp.]EIQ7064725.1 replication initiation protein [Enterococcus faecalis]EJE4057042.1 replication initiation protein [Enterococcus faecalis]EJE4057288.1 replication initiation protein [Enterococcus faecalis]
MANELVKYHTELNTIPLRKFSPVEMNLFFSIVSRMRDKGEQTVRFSFDQLKDLSDYKATANSRFIDDIYSTYEKILSLRFGNRSANGLNRSMFVMFTQFEIVGDTDEPYVDIKLFEKAIPLLNGLDEWVRYSLKQFNELQSSYSKTMFRLLKQFRTTGYAYFSKEDFSELLDIPKSYRESDINKNIFKPIKEELTPLFRGLTIKKKYGKGRGKPVIGYQFSFKAEAKNADDFSKGERENLRIKMFNIEHNGELSQEEKWVAKDKVLGLKIGTHEADYYSQQQKESDKIEEEKLRKDLLKELQNGFK